MPSVERRVVAAVSWMYAACAGLSVAGAPTDSIAVLDTMVVQAVRNAVEEPLLESPALELSVSVVDADDIAAQASHTVVDAVKYVPGAWVETRGRKVKSFVSVRGQKYPYPDYAVDGVWQREFDELPYFFPSFTLQRVEVLRSSAALINGVSGLTGIINVIPKTYDSLGIDADVSYGTFNTYRADIAHGHTLGSLSYALGVGAMQTDGPADMHAAEEAMNFSGRVKWQPNTNLAVQANVFGLYGSREVAFIEWPGDTTLNRRQERFDPYRALIANARGMYSWNDRTSTSLLLYYTRRNHEYYIADTASEPNNLELDWEWGMNLIQAVSLWDHNVWRVSALYNNWVAPDGKRFYQGKRCALQTVSVGISDEQTLGGFSVDAGVRWLKDYIDEYAAYNVEGTFVWKTGRQNVALDPVTDTWRKSQVTATLGLSYRFPFGMSLFGHGAFGYVNPLPGSVDSTLAELDAEKQGKFDVGLKAGHARVGTIVLSGFYVNRADGIDITSAWDTVVVDGDSLSLPFHRNVDMTSAGLEVELRTARFLDAAEGFVNATFMRHRVRSGSDFEPDTTRPAIIIGGGLNLTLGPIDLNVYGKHVSEYTSDRFANKVGGVPVAVEIGDYSTLDLSAGYTHALAGGHEFRLYVAVDNLTDRRYCGVVGYPDFGRKVSVGLRYSY